LEHNVGNHSRKNHEISLVLGETFDPERTGRLQLPVRPPDAADHRRPLPPVAHGRHRRSLPIPIPDLGRGRDMELGPEGPLRWSQTTQRATGVAAAVTVAIVIGLILNRDPALQSQSAADILIPPTSAGPSVSVTSDAPASHQTVRDLLTKSTGTEGAQPLVLEPKPSVEASKLPAVANPPTTPQQPAQTQPAAPPSQPQEAFCDTKASCVAYSEVIVAPTQLGCFQDVIMRESGWNIHALNYTSGAYGLAQALPASRYASAGDDWRDNGATQLRWALEYMDERYGSPCGAWGFWLSHNWY
jgi:hypothetical protein